MWELDHKEGFMPKNWCFWTVVLEKTLESPLDWKDIQPFHPKGNQFWIFIERTDAKAEAPISWPSDAKIWLIEKDTDAGKNWRQEKRTTEDEMVRWNHRLVGHEFEQALGVGDGQGSLECCSPRGCKESDATEQLNWTEPRWKNKGFIRSQLLDGDKSIGYGVRRQPHSMQLFVPWSYFYVKCILAHAINTDSASFSPYMCDSPVPRLEFKFRPVYLKVNE